MASIESTVDSVETVCQEADRLVSTDRSGDYGHPLDDFCRTAVIWSGILGLRVTYKEVALCMDGVKTSREVNKPKRDNRTDKCGYTKCLDLCYAEERRRLADGWTFDAFTGKWHKPQVALSMVAAPGEFKITK